MKRLLPSFDKCLQSIEKSNRFAIRFDALNYSADLDYAVRLLLKDLNSQPYESCDWPENCSSCSYPFDV